MNVNQIELALSQKISASSTDFDLLAASKALQFLKTNGVFVASSYGGLPAAASNEGKIYFIEDIETVVWSNGTDWLRLLDKAPFTQIWGWGYNNGRLGDGAVTTRCSPVREISSSTDWRQVSAGYAQSMAVKTSGELWVWGIGSCGVLGDGTLTTKCSPVREFCSATDWCSVSTGCRHTTAVKSAGEIWSWGLNTCGRLGDGTLTGSCSPIREICSATDWCNVSAGCRHTIAIKTSGQIWGWGDNGGSTLGDGTSFNIRCSPVREISSSTNWCQVDTGQNHTAAIKTSGELWSWGTGTGGRLGTGASATRNSPVQEFCSATDWCQVSAGEGFTTAVKTSGELWAWGTNFCGLLGDGTTTGACSPVREICSATDWCQASAGTFHTHAVKTSGQIWGWGSNAAGLFHLGTGASGSSCSPVREFCSATDWCQVSVGGNHTLAIKIT